MHHKEPYNPNNPNHINQLNKWKNKPKPSYKRAILEWSQRDPLKRQTAINNNLNHLEIWEKDYKKGLDYILELIKNFPLK